MKKNIISSVSGRPQLNRRINVALILSLVRKNGSISRAGLAKATGIRATSVSAIVQELIEKRIVREVGLGKSTGGRQAVLLELNPDGGYAVGIEVSDTGINVILVNFIGIILQKVHSTLQGTGIDGVVNAIEAVVDRVLSKSGIKKEQLVGVGIAVPGIISQSEDVVLFSRSLKWHDVRLKELVEVRVGVRVRVVNNAIAGALASDYELNKDATARALLFFMVRLKNATHNSVTTLGCGIVMDGRAYLGDGHLAGEVCVDIKHPVLIASKSNKFLHIYDLVRESVINPDLYCHVWDDFSRSLGTVIARGSDFINPGKIVIGTDVPELEGLVSASLRNVVYEKSLMGVVGKHAKTLVAASPLVEFVLLETETLAKGAVIPLLQELSLTPLFGESALM